MVDICTCKLQIESSAIEEKCASQESLKTNDFTNAFNLEENIVDTPFRKEIADEVHKAVTSPSSASL